MAGMKRLAILLLLAGCAQAQTAETLPPLPADDTCDAARHASLIGQDATALERVLVMGRVRVIRPRQPVTMDYWPGRINFVIDEDERISRITCG